LENAAYEMAAGNAPGFSFLLDMNAVFEDYVQAALQAHFGTFVSSQHEVGALLRAPRKAIAQRADFRWQTKANLWLGDAKYKFPSTLPDADDVRQITVYGEIEARQKGKVPHLALFYPFIGGEFRAKVSRAWNESLLFWVPVHLSPSQRNLRFVLPQHW
jgi:5-methylcytosine-specific restriction endonuclease McrBC regulatory subunit McrC